MIPKINIYEKILGICLDITIIIMTIFIEKGILLNKPDIKPLNDNNFVPIKPHMKAPEYTEKIK
jgi:hypothetical protein